MTTLKCIVSFEPAAQQAESPEARRSSRLPRALLRQVQRPQAELQPAQRLVPELQALQRPEQQVPQVLQQRQPEPPAQPPVSQPQAALAEPVAALLFL
jgi:hypothetical protein